MTTAEQCYDTAMSKMNARLLIRKCCNTYKYEYIKFCKWVRENLPPQEQAGGQYITRSNIDEYFSRSVVGRFGLRATISRTAVSLQWFYTHVEQPGGPQFTVRSTSVAESINIQQDNNKAGADERHAGVDPHKGLKDLMPEEDIKKILTHMHKRRNDWGSLSMSFTWGCNAGVRGASSRKLTLCDLNMSRGFGPVRKGPRSRTLMLVLRKGDTHKDNHTTDKQVAVWRHRDYLLCSAFNTALHVINTLRENPTINFKHLDKKERASWWDFPLIDYESLDQESSAMKEVLAATEVESCKVTHNRTQAVQRAGSEGLAPWQVNTFTKHLLNKFHTAYQSESDKEACKVMAGFSKEEAHFIPEEYLKMPWDMHVLTRLLLPGYSRWLIEAASPLGDKSSCCRHFLIDILPFLVQVLVQDGIFLIADFPNHPMSQYLKVRVSFFLSLCLIDYHF
jgi:hypothetical protein